MSEFLFGSGHGCPLHARAVDRIAISHGANLVTYTEPGGERRYWFAARNFGEPRNARLERDLHDALTAAGHIVGGALRTKVRPR